MKTYLITGGAGFIGSHLTDALLERGDAVLSVDDLSTGKMDNIRHVLEHPRFQFARCSIMDKTVMDRLASQADVIVHLAAAVGVKLIVQYPVRTIETNVIGTESVMRAALRYGCRVLLASSSEVYGKGIKIPFQEEDDVLLGNTAKSRWTYAVTKMLDECLGLAYSREYGLEVVPFRLFNTVGPRQTGQYGMVIPNFVRQAVKNEPITVYGDGSQRRAFCDVRDVVTALVGLAEHPKSPGQLFNIGSGEEVSILELAERVKRMTNSRSEIALVPYDQAYEPGFEDMQRRLPDTKRLCDLIGWKPTRNLDAILGSVIEYEKGMGK